MKVDERLLFQHIGLKIREQRESMNMSQSALGESVKLRRTSISNIELGVQKLPIHVLYNLCIQLGLEPKDILPTIEQATKKPEVADLEMGGKVRRIDPRNVKLLRKYKE